MSRVIKFRAWVNNHWTDFIPVAKTLGIYNESIIDVGGYTYEKTNPFIVEQYTGLKDRNGKEIYEGDIVYDIYTGDEVFIVGWDKDKASFMLADIADYPMAYFDEYELDKDLEVIGNIHENPELLGGQNENNN